MTLRVGINGFGRIGRNFYRAAASQDADIEIVAVNDLGSVEQMTHLLRYDSVHGRLPYDVSLEGSTLLIDRGSSPDAPTDRGSSPERIEVLAERDPAELPWGELGVDIVIESTGIFTSREKAAAHLRAGASKVIISAPGKEVDATFVVGVNDHTYDPNSHHVVSNASCTTNCFVPLVKVLDDAFGVKQGFMTTIHAYTGDQSIVDGPHSDLRRARAAAVNIIPTSTGAARATGLVLEAMQGLLDGAALRVPVPDGSITDFVAVLKAEPTADEINQAFQAAAQSGSLADVLEYSQEPLVSSDIVGSAASCVFDSKLTLAQGSLAKVFGWYDNEWGYSCRLVDLALLMGSRH